MHNKPNPLARLILAGCAAAALLLAAGPGTAGTYGPNPSVNYNLPNWAYSQQPAVSVQLAGGGGGGAIAVPWLDINGGIANIQVIDGGAGYTTAPDVSITGSGSGAAATAIIDPTLGTVTNVTVSTAGSGYGAYAMRKFVDALPGLDPTTPNENNQYIPIAVPVKWSGNGVDDYYEIAAVEYGQLMHSDLAGPSRMRGYVQIYPPGTLPPDGSPVIPLVYPDSSAILFNGQQVYAYTNPQCLGPIIMATKGTPVRIEFYNLLPVGSDGGLFVPVDTTVTGAGMGPEQMGVGAGMDVNYKQNRASIHLRGGNIPWISEGTPNQWTVPVGETTTPYMKGVSSQDVPDMPPSGDGVLTFYFPNKQSSRLMFYQDNSYGISRLNAYAGLAAGYLLQDPVGVGENTLGLPAAANQLPLIVEDKTFVWDPAGDQTSGTYATDPLFATAITDPLPALPGDLWFPSVYMPNQDPTDPSGMSPFGRWDYGAWFWPVFPTMGDLPTVSCVPEAFMDTPVVNGTAYPYWNVQPQAYRLRIVNACNDRTLNLSLWVADVNGFAIDDNGDPAALTPPFNYTEVKTVPFSREQNVRTPFPAWWYQQGLPFTLDNRVGGVPDPTTRGPAMIQIGSDGGLLPAPALIRNQPVNYDYDRRSETVLNVKQHALLLGPGEGADVIVDFSNFSGMTLLLYNDAPAPNPLGDPRNDPFTGAPDLTAMGGAPTTIPGYGPNIRTVMQIRVASGGSSTAPPDDYNASTLTALQTSLPAAFAATQPQLIVPANTYAFVSNTSLTIGASGAHTLLLKSVSELFDSLGRMNAQLGTELAFTKPTTETTIPLHYLDPASEVINDGETQLWKIVHNGEDTHALEFTLANVQVVNRVGWDGAVKPPDANELGWKNTVRVNPHEDIVVAIQPKLQAPPFKVPNSVRPYDVTMPLGTTTQFTGVDPATGLPMAVANASANFGWEYSWDCAMLGHEANDMMRPVVLHTGPPASPIPISPTNTIGTRTPNYMFHTVVGATLYRVILHNVAKGTTTGTAWFTTAQVDSANTGIGTIAQSSALALGSYTWYVQAQNSFGFSGYSVGLDFNIGPPASPTPISPSGAIGTATPAYTFTLVSGADEYRVILLNVTKSTYTSTAWFTTAQVDFPVILTGTITQATALANGDYIWYVQARNGIGASSWSTALSFTVGPPATPTAISPSGPDTPTTPIYTFTTGGGATQYRIILVSAGGTTGSAWFSSTQVDPTSSGQGTITQAPALATGDYTWYVQARNSIGYSHYSNGLAFHVD